MILFHVPLIHLAIRDSLLFVVSLRDKLGEPLSIQVCFVYILYVYVNICLSIYTIEIVHQLTVAILVHIL